MVKNTKGGNKHKKMARKQIGEQMEEKVRFSTCSQEIYASVARIYGNGRILVTCNDGIERLCVIRKKFKGRNKRNNQIQIGTYILIGKRDWNSVSTGKIETTDLLYVYSNEQSGKLKRNDAVNDKILSKNERHHQENSNDQQASNFFEEEEEEETEEEESNVDFVEENNDNGEYFTFNYQSSDEEEDKRGDTFIDSI